MAVFKFDFDQILAADAQISFTTGVDSLCDGLIVNLLNNSSNATNYKWLFGNGDSSNLENPSVTYQDLGTYEIQLIAYDTTCQITDTAVIQVEHRTARKPIVNFLSTYTSCDQNLEVQFQNLSIISNAYEWNFGDGTTSSSPNPKHAVSEGTNSNLILLPNSPNAASNMLNDLVASFAVGNKVAELNDDSSQNPN